MNALQTRRLFLGGGVRPTKRLVLGAAVLVAVLLSSVVGSGRATAATPCHSVEVESTTVRVAVVAASCELGREVAVGYFERTLSEDHFEGKTGDGAIYYDVDGLPLSDGAGWEPDVLPPSR